RREAPAAGPRSAARSVDGGRSTSDHRRCGGRGRRAKGLLHETARAVRRDRRSRAGHSSADRHDPGRRVRLMIVLDTNVVSELMKESPDEAVWRWFLTTRREGLYTTAITAAEIHYGIERLPGGSRRRKLVREAADEIFGEITDEVLPFGAEAAMAFPVVVT